MTFPITTSTLQANAKLTRRIGPFNRALDVMEALTAAGVTSKGGFTDLRRTFNGVLDDVFDVRIFEAYCASGRWETLPKEVYEFYTKHLFMPALHNIKGKLDKAKKFATKHPHALLSDAIDLLEEWMPIVGAVEDLKDKVTVRQPKPVEERKPGYHPPKVSTSGERRVLALLEEVVHPAYEDFLHRLIESTTSRIVHIMGRLCRAQQNTIWNYYEAQRKAATGRFEIVGLTQEQAFITPYLLGTKAPFIRAPEWKTWVERNCTQHADMIRNTFVCKNLSKLATLVDAAGADMVEPQVLSRTVNLDGMTGTFRFSWPNGGAFTARNSVVYVPETDRAVSFVRFPLTFHDVTLPGGGKLSIPSEERMNEVWVKAFDNAR